MAFFDVFGSLFGKKPVKTEKEMYLRIAGPGQPVHQDLRISAGKRVEWVSEQTDEEGNPVTVRVPQEHTTQYSKTKPFSMAGKIYPNLNSFLRKRENDWGEDLYGRQVLCLLERFPCFDSYDYMHEDRYYRWYFIREGNTLSCLYSSDGMETIRVTEDVANLEGKTWREMERCGFCQRVNGDKQ